LGRSFADAGAAIGTTSAKNGTAKLLDMEGLKQWQPGRTEGYAALDAAVRRFGTVDEFVKTVVAQCK
jgi:hypothetical protein